MSDQDEIEDVASPNDTVDDEVIEIDDAPDTDTNDKTQDEPAQGENEVEVLKKKNKQLFERTMRAEGKVFDPESKKWVKKATPKPEVSKDQPNTAQYPSPEELYLIAQGKDKASVEQLKKVAKATDKTLEEAQSDELYLAWEKEHQAEVKRNKAKLNASQGSGSEPQKAKFEAGLSPEEHKKAWQEAMGR